MCQQAGKLVDLGDLLVGAGSLKPAQEVKMALKLMH